MLGPPAAYTIPDTVTANNGAQFSVIVISPLNRLSSPATQARCITRLRSCNSYADPFIDIYSLAKVVIEMLAGCRLSELLPNAFNDLSDRVRELLGGSHGRLSTQCIELLRRALEYDPSRRRGKADSFAHVIAKDLDHYSDVTQAISQGAS